MLLRKGLNESLCCLLLAPRCFGAVGAFAAATALPSLWLAVCSLWFLQWMLVALWSPLLPLSFQVNVDTMIFWLYLW